MKDLQNSNINNINKCGQSPTVAVPPRAKFVAPKETQYRDVVIIGEDDLRILNYRNLESNFLASVLTLLVAGQKGRERV